MDTLVKLLLPIKLAVVEYGGMLNRLRLYFSDIAFDVLHLHIKSSCVKFEIIFTFFLMRRIIILLSLFLKKVHIRIKVNWCCQLWEFDYRSCFLYFDIITACLFFLAENFIG